MTRGGMSLVLSCAMVLGCSKTPPAPPRAGGSEVGSGSATAVVASKLIDFENGLTRQQREEFYHLAEGSEVFPLDWLQAIDNVHTGRRFLTDVERFGLIPDPDNSDGLPIGLTGASSR